MLADLDKIDWGSIQHSHGKADKFPYWIRDLLSNNSGIRAAAYENIREYSHHQGSIYEVTSYVIPFLIELLGSENVPDRVKLYDLICSYTWSYSHTRPLRRQQLEEATPNSEFYNHILESKTFESRAFQEIQKGLDLYIGHLEHSDKQIRLMALALIVYLCCFDALINNSQALRFAQIMEPYLTKPYDFMDLPAEHRIQRWFVVSLCLTLEWIANQISPVIHLTFLPHTKHHDDAHFAASNLLDALFNEELYFDDRTLKSQLVNLTFHMLDCERSPKRLFDVFIPYIRGRSDYKVDDSKERMYEKPSGTIDSNHVYAMQRKALKQILSADILWSIPTNILEIYGLPADRKSAHELLGFGG